MQKSTRKSSSAGRRTLSKKHLQNSKNNNQEKSAVANNSPPKLDSSNDVEDVVGVLNYNMMSSTGCSTPKTERFRIPEIKTCPPAPKKRRILRNCTIRRSTPIAFFAPPDIDHLFYLALRGLPV